MSHISRSQSFTKGIQQQNESFSQDSKCVFDDIPNRQKQYSEDTRDYYNLYNKRDSMIDNVNIDDTNTKSKEESSPSHISSLKQMYMLKAISKLSKREGSKLIGERSPISRSSIKLLKNLNGSLVLEKEESTPKVRNLENNESYFKFIANSAQDHQDQQKEANLLQNNNDEQTENDYTIAGGENEDNKNQYISQRDNQAGNENNVNQTTFRQQATLKQKSQQENKLQKVLSNFNKLNNIKKFVKKMTGLSPQYNYRRLKDFHFQVIGDAIQVISSQFKSQKGESLFVLKPNEIFSLVWEIFEILFLFFHVIAFGFRFGYGILLNYYIKIFSIIFFIFDLLVIMNTGYYQGIEIVTDRLKILKYNVFNIFMIIISLVALVFSDQGPMQFVFIFRIKQLYRSYNHFEQNFQIKQKHPVSATLVRLFLIIILLAHYNACGFYFFTTNYNNSDTNWLDFQGISNSNWETKYITALYFSFITMVTVGYGDVVPKTQNERIYIIFFVLISAITFAYVVNTIGSLFQEVSRLEGKFNQKKFEIMNYMEERNISKSIQISVVKFLEYNIRQEKELQYSLAGEIFLQSIPLKLRQQVYQEYYGRILEEIKLFSMNFSKDFLKQLSVLMKEKTFGPGEEIIKQGDKNNTFFFINKGLIEFDIELLGKNIINLGVLKKQVTLFYNKKFIQQKGDSFNHKGLFTDQIHEVTARCKQITQIIYLNHEDFQRVLKQNKDEYEKYCMMKDKFFQDNFSLGEKCLSCQEFNHSVLSCNFIKYSPNRSNLIAKEQYNIPILNRTQYERKNHLVKYNCLANNYDVKQALRTLRLQLTYMIMGQKIGSFSELADKNFTDEQFFQFYPELQMNSEKYIYINSMDDLNKSLPLDNAEQESVIQNNNNINSNNYTSNQIFTRDSGMHDTFLLKIPKPMSVDQQYSQLSVIAPLEKPFPSEEHIEVVLSPQKKIQISDQQTNENLNENESEGISSKQDLQLNQQEKERAEKGYFKMTSLKGGGKDIPQPQPSQNKIFNRRISIIQNNAGNIFQQGQNSIPFHNLINFNQQSHNELNQVITQNDSTLQQQLQLQQQQQIQQQQVQQQQQQNNNSALLQILSILEKISNNQLQNSAGGIGIGQHFYSSINKKPNIKSMTQINREQQLNLNANSHTFYLQSFTKIPTNTNNNNNTAQNPITNQGEGGDNGDKFYLSNDFDLLKEYKYYFPSTNFSQIKVLYHQYLENKQRKMNGLTVLKKK